MGTDLINGNYDEYIVSLAWPCFIIQLMTITISSTTSDHAFLEFFLGIQSKASIH